MTEYVVNLGAHVKSMDGTSLGHIDKLIVHPATGTVDGFILSRGVFSTPKIVEASNIASADGKEVTLRIDADTANHLPNLFEEQLLRAPGPLTYEVGMGGMVDIGGSGNTWVLRGTDGGDLPHTGASSFFATAPIGLVETQNVSSLESENLTVNDDADVIAADGKKIGTVDTVILGENRRVIAILVKSGWLFKHSTRIPATSISGVAHDHIRLSITSEQAEQLPHES